MFGFFNKWKRSGRGVGIKNGVGKLAMFDQDGNVISSGVSADDVRKIYQHTVTLPDRNLISGEPMGEATYTILSRSSAPLNTWAKLRDATPVTRIPCSGYCYFGMTEVWCVGITIHRVGTGSDAVIEMKTAPNDNIGSFDYQFNSDNVQVVVDVVKEI